MECVVAGTAGKTGEMTVGTAETTVGTAETTVGTAGRTGKDRGNPRPCHLVLPFIITATY